MRQPNAFAIPPSGPFTAVVWKELRQNLKWSIIGMLGMTIGLVYQLQRIQLYYSGINSVGTTPEVTTLFDLTTFVSAAIGLMLGVAQTVTENSGDKWGFLAHRPVNRSTIFWAKSTAGSVLHLIAAGLPISIALIWMAIPEHLAVPFDWKLIQPAIADVLCGLVFYFAGILIGMRNARWYATRILGIGTALLCSIAVSTLMHFWQALVAIGIGLVVMGTAAWGTFGAGGHYGSQPRRSRAAVAISVAIGIVFVAGIASATIMSFAYRESPFGYIDYSVTSDGSIVKTKNENGETVGVWDLEGHILPDFKKRFQTMSVGVMSTSLSLSRRPPKPEDTAWRNRYRGTSGLYDAIYSPDAGYNGGSVNWFFIHRLQLIAAYSKRTGKLVGWFGPDGFSEGTTRPRSFGGNLKTSDRFATYYKQSILALDNAIYRYDLEQRSIEKVFEPQAGERILTASSSTYDAASLSTFGESARYEVIATDRRLIVQLRDGTRLVDVPHDPKATMDAQLEIERPMKAEGTPLFATYRATYNTDARRPALATKFARDGHVMAHYELPNPYPIVTEPWKPIVLMATFYPFTFRAAEGLSNYINHYNPRLSRSVEISSWAFPILGSLIAAGFVISRCKQYVFTRGRTALWVASALLFGPLALVTMLGLLDWPQLEACPSCGRKRIVTRDHCEHCSQPFAAPAMDGTEIFEL